MISLQSNLSSLSRLRINAAMSPPYLREMTIVPGLATMSPANRAPVDSSRKHRWPGSCPGVWMHRNRHCGSRPLMQDFVVVQVTVDLERHLSGGGRMGHDRHVVPVAQFIGRGRYGPGANGSREWPRLFRRARSDDRSAASSGRSSASSPAPGSITYSASSPTMRQFVCVAGGIVGLLTGTSVIPRRISNQLCSPGARSVPRVRNGQRAGNPTAASCRSV